MKTVPEIVICSFFIISFLVIWNLSKTTPQKTVIQKPFMWNYDTPRQATIFLDSRTRILSEDLCNPVTLLVIVHSQPSNRRARNSIRKSWGRGPLRDSLVLFLLGNPSDSILQKEIFEESREFGDLIQEDFVDTYSNLTLKSITMLKLALHCDHSFKYLLKTDDDTLVNLERIVEMLTRDGSEDLLIGHLFCEAVPNRNPQSKWYTPFWLYWGDIYPLYLSGGGYLMSWDVAQKIFLKVRRIPLFHLEDVYLTGFCAKTAGVKPKHSDFFVKKGTVYRRKECFLKEALAVFDVTIEEMIEWDSVIKDDYWARKCIEFSSINWVWDSVFKSWDNVFSYRKTCR